MFLKAFKQLGEDWNVKPHVLKQEQLTSLVYGQNREFSMAVVPTKSLRKMAGEGVKPTSKSKVDVVRLSPCHSI